MADRPDPEALRRSRRRFIGRRFVGLESDRLPEHGVNSDADKGD